MTDLELILNKIQNLQADREANPPDTANSRHPNNAKWREIGFDDGLDWVVNEISKLLESSR